MDKIKDRPEGIKLASEGTEEISSSEKDEVEEILARKIVRGQWLYNVQWKAGGNTWEPVENLDNCAILLRKFMKTLKIPTTTAGHDADNYHPAPDTEYLQTFRAETSDHDDTDPVPGAHHDDTDM